MVLTLPSNDCWISCACVEALCASTSPTKATTPRTATDASTHPGTLRLLLDDRSISSTISLLFPLLRACGLLGNMHATRQVAKRTGNAYQLENSGNIGTRS